MTEKNLYFLDFDGTLFHTEAFWADVQDACHSTLGISHTLFHETYVATKLERTVYDIDAHLTRLGITQESLREVMGSIFAKKSYAFPDVAPFFEKHKENEIVILTQGIDWFQRVKVASLASSIGTPHTIVVPYKKRQYIEQNVEFNKQAIVWDGRPYNSLTFIDNMADAFLEGDFGERLHQYRIRRYGADEHAHEPTRAGSIEITTLDDI